MIFSTLFKVYINYLKYKKFIINLFLLIYKIFCLKLKLI
jgi:hypothetical protein